MKFEYSGFKLRRAIPEDAKGFIEISHDPDVMLYYGEGDGVCKTGESAAQQIKWCNEEFKRNAGRWIIIEKGRNEYIGDIGFSGFVARHKRAEIGYRLM